MELEDTEILTQKSVTGSSDTALERIVNQTITDTSILPPFISKLDVNTGLSGISAIPFVDTVGADDANFTVGSTKVSKSKDFTTAEVTTETIEDAVTEVGIDSTIQNILDIQTVKKIEASILEALNSDTRIRYSMNPSWAGIHEGILELGSDIYSIVGTIYVAVSLPVYLNLIENEDENLVKLLGSKLKLVIMEGFTNSQLLIVHEYGVAGGIGVKNIEKERKPVLDRVDYTAPFTHSFGWDPRFIRFSGALYSRYFRRNEGTTDYATIPAVTLTDDLVIECEVLTTLSGGTTYEGLFGSEVSEATERAYSLVLRDNGQVLFIFGNGAAFQTVATDAGAVESNKLTAIRIIRTDDLIKIYIGGNESASGMVSGFPMNPINRVYSYIGGGYLSGILANLKIWDNGTLIRDYPLNDNSNVLANRATSLGHELVVNGDFTHGLLGWTLNNSVSTVSNGVLTIDDSDDAGTNSGVFKSVELIEGVDYVLSYDLLSVTTGIFISVSGTSLGVGAWLIANDARTGVREITFTAAANSYLWVAVGGTGSLELESISIRQADGYGTIINGNASDWGLFDKQANGDWLGQELLFNGDFSQGASGWSGTVAETVFADNKLYYNGTTNNVIYQSVINNAGTYLVTADIESFTRNASTPRPQFQVINNNGYQPITSGVAGLGSIYYDVSDASNPNSYFELGQFGSGAELVVNSFSVKEVLKNA